MYAISYLQINPERPLWCIPSKLHCQHADRSSLPSCILTLSATFDAEATQHELVIALLHQILPKWDCER